MAVAHFSCLYVRELPCIAWHSGGFIVIMDPHDHVFFSPPFVRALINTNQRFSYPALARSERFDSLVIGTSTV